MFSRPQPLADSLGEIRPKEFAQLIGKETHLGAALPAWNGSSCRWKIETGVSSPFSYSDFNLKNFRPALAGTVTEICAPLVTAGCATGDQPLDNATFVLSCN